MPVPVPKYPAVVPNPNDLNEFSSVAAHALAVMQTLGADPLGSVSEATLRAWIDRIDAQPPSGGILDSNGIQSATFADEDIERVFYTLTIPANTVQIGDLINIQFYVEMLAPSGGGGVTTRMRLNDELGAIIVDAGDRTPLGFPTQLGFEFFHALVIDTGSGLSAARVVFANDSVDFVFDFTADVDIAFTAEWSTADADNEYRGLAAHISRS